MQVDANPFPVNVVDQAKKQSARLTAEEKGKQRLEGGVSVKGEGNLRLLTSEKARAEGSVDKSVQITVGEIDIKADGKGNPRSYQIKGRPEIGRWYKVGKPSATERKYTPKVTFSQLLGKYEGRKGVARGASQPKKTDRQHQEEQHWECPFFQLCWDKRLRLPSVKECPRQHLASRSSNRHGRYEQQRSDCSFFQYCWEKGLRLPSAEECPKQHFAARPAERDPGPQRTRASVKKRLGRPIPEGGQEGPKVESIKARVPKSNRWCPEGLTKSQKRRLQRLKTTERRKADLEGEKDRLFNKDHTAHGSNRRF